MGTDDYNTESYLSLLAAMLFRIRRANVALLIALSLTLFGFADAAFAQTSSKSSETSAQKAIVELSSKLTREQSAALEKFLEVLAKDNTTGSATLPRQRGTMQLLRESLDTFANRILDHIVDAPTAIGAVGSAIKMMFAARPSGGGWRFAGLLTIALLAGAAATVVVGWFTRSWRKHLSISEPRTLLELIRSLSLRLFLELSGLAGFVIVSLLSGRLLASNPDDHFLIAAFVLSVILIIWLARALLRFVLSPNRPDLRLVTTDDWTARLVFQGLVSFAAVIGLGLFLLQLLDRFSIGHGQTLRFWVAFFLVIWISFLTWRARAGLTSMIKGDELSLTPGLERMAAWWPIVSIVAIALTWLFIQFATSTGALQITAAQGSAAFGLIIAAPFLDTALRGIVKHILPTMQGEGEAAEEAYLRTRHSYIRIGRVLMFATIILLIGHLFGISFRDFAAASLGAQIAANGFQFLLTIALGYLAWELVNLWVDRQLAREMPAEMPESEAEGEGGGAGKSRLATVLPLLRITLQIAIIVLTALLGLAQLGFNITPLLAGAGVVGIAVGFGAQALVKDVVSGIFFLLDDAFRLGEYIDVGGTLGTVEKISIRSLRLRGARGPIHIVPYGEIQKLTNHSRDWVIVKMSFHVPFDTDTEKVRKIFKRIGQEMMEVPELAKDFLSPFKGQGVYDVDDVGIVVRAKFTAKPGTQFMIRKEIYKRIQQAFEDNGIQFARREVRVQFPDGDHGTNLTPDQKQAIAAAATADGTQNPV
jgi:small-conductance mechanosensitive channel